MTSVIWTSPGGYSVDLGRAGDFGADLSAREVARAAVADLLAQVGFADRAQVLEVAAGAVRVGAEDFKVRSLFSRGVRPGVNVEVARAFSETERSLLGRRFRVVAVMHGDFDVVISDAWGSWRVSAAAVEVFSR